MPYFGTPGHLGEQDTEPSPDVVAEQSYWRFVHAYSQDQCLAASLVGCKPHRLALLCMPFFVGHR